MRVIKVEFNGEVFIPLEAVDPSEIKEAVVIIEVKEESKSEGYIKYGSPEYKDWRPLPREERIKRAFEEYKSKFNEEPDMELLEMVGIAPPLTPEDQKKELRYIIEQRHLGMR